MNPTATLKLYPRPDTQFRTKCSLDFDMMRAKIITNRSSKGAGMMLWCSHVLCGFLMGVLAFMLSVCEDQFTKWRCALIQSLIQATDNALVASYLFWVLSSVLLVLVASLLTVYV